MSRAVMQQALDALKQPRPGIRTDLSDALAYREKVEAAITALREELAKPEREPFGYFKAEPFGWTDCAETDDGAKALYEAPPQRQFNDDYTSEAETEELIRIGELPEPLRLAAMLEKTMQWPLHGKAADCLRRMYAEQRQPLTTPQYVEALGPLLYQIVCSAGTLRRIVCAIEAEHGIGNTNA